VTPLQPDELLSCLARYDVRYVLIGGLAAVLHGSPLPTVDADICPARDSGNLSHLASALKELDARIRTPDTPSGVPFPYDAEFLRRVELLNMTTRFGDLDISFAPSGTAGYDELIRNAGVMTIRDLSVSVASLEDVIRSKTAANRPKDRRMLPILSELLAEIQKRREQS
jgi:hypothetical protein